MTSQQKLEDIYEDVNRLLYDICYFLTGELRNGTLSPEATNQAKQLVARSQKQVVVINAVSLQQDDQTAGLPYMQMQGADMNDEDCPAEYVETDCMDGATPEEENYYQILPTDTKNNMVSNALPSVPIAPADNCPYNNTPANDILNTAVKYGPLYRKERYLFVGPKKQFFVALVDHWLLVYYNGKRDMKPIQVLNMNYYNTNKLEQKKDPMFELISPGKKSFEFIGRSFKDVEQWVVAIISCKCTNGKKIDLSEPTSDNKETPETDGDISEVDSEIYENVDELKVRSQNHTSSSSCTDMPSLPPRRLTFNSHETKLLDHENNKYNNVSTKRTKSTDSENSTYDFISSVQSENNSDVYEDPHNEESVEYDELEDIKDSRNTIKEVKVVLPKSEEEDEDIEYDELGDYERKPEMTNNVTKQSDQLDAMKNNYGVFVSKHTEEDDEDVEYDELIEYQKSEENDNKTKIVSPKKLLDCEMTNNNHCGTMPKPTEDVENIMNKEQNMKEQKTQNIVLKNREEVGTKRTQHIDFVPKSDIVEDYDEDVEYDELGIHPPVNEEKNKSVEILTLDRKTKIEAINQNVCFPSPKSLQEDLEDEDLIYDELGDSSQAISKQNGNFQIGKVKEIPKELENKSVVATHDDLQKKKGSKMTNDSVVKKIENTVITKPKPAVFSKPKINLRLGPRKTTEVVGNPKIDNPNPGENNNRIQNLIQQMERSLSFKAKKN